MRPTEMVQKFIGVIHYSIRKCDLFSQKIMFTYKGEPSFSTFLGGFVSVAIFIVVGVYFGFLMQAMITRSNSNNSKSTEVIDLTIHDEDYYPVEKVVLYYFLNNNFLWYFYIK